MRELLEQGYWMIFMTAMAGVGVLCKGCLFFYYVGIGQACKNFAESKNKTIAFIRKDLEKRKNAELSIKSAMVYTECRLAERRVLGIRLGILETVSDRSLLLVLLSGVLAAFSGVLSGCENETAFRTLFLSGALAFFLMTADLVTGLKEKSRRVRLSIRDYIENRWTWEEECEEVSEELSVRELRQQKRADRKEEKRNKKAERREIKEGKKTEKREEKVKAVKEKQEKMKSVRGRKKGKAQEEKRRLTEELLRERRQLEARHFAQQRSMVCTESAENTTQESNRVIVSDVLPENGETEQEQVKEEAAVTVESAEMTYERLLSEVIAEYLA